MIYSTHIQQASSQHSTPPPLHNILLGRCYIGGCLFKKKKILLCNIWYIPPTFNKLAPNIQHPPLHNILLGRCMSVGVSGAGYSPQSQVEIVHNCQVHMHHRYVTRKMHLHCEISLAHAQAIFYCRLWNINVGLQSNEQLQRLLLPIHSSPPLSLATLPAYLHQVHCYINIVVAGHIQSYQQSCCLQFFVELWQLTG